MAKDRKILVGIQDIQCPLILHVISRSKRAKPNKYKNINLVLGSCKIIGIQL
jgi:hypothetical protein